MRRFPCPACGRSLLEGTTLCPHCRTETPNVTAPPSPGERFPEIDFGTHELAEDFALLVDASVDDSDSAPRFYPLLQFAAWGSPWMEEYLRRIEEGSAPRPPNVDVKAMTMREHLDRRQRGAVRHYLTKLQAVPEDVQMAVVECLELDEWTPEDRLSSATRQWLRTLAKSGVVERDASEEERLASCDEEDLRALLARHGQPTIGGPRELVGRIFDAIKAPDWQSFARAKRPGRLVRCKLPIAAELRTYLQVRRARIRLIVESVLNRERIAREAARLKEQGVSDEAFAAAEVSLPPFHPGCRCRLSTRQEAGKTFLVAAPEADACRACADIAAAVEQAVGECTARAPSPETAVEEEPADFYADREWPWRPGRCPRCRRGMYNARRGGLFFHACSECHGIWLPWRIQKTLFTEYPDLVGRLDTDFTYYRHLPGRERETQRCPDCETVELEDCNYVLQVNGRRYDTGVLTHCCPQCRGMWFDHSELHQISKEQARRKAENGASP